MLRRLLIALTFLFPGCRLYEPPRYTRLPPAPDAPHVLLIGNSLTYYNDLPGLLQQLSAGAAQAEGAEASGGHAPLYEQAITFPAASLRFHLAASHLLEKIRAGGPTGHWDFVVLQDYSREPVTHPESSAASFEKLAAAVHEVGATPILFENWTRKGHADDAGPLRAFYTALAARTGARVAPIGTAFRLARSLHPEVPLLVDDRHPTDAGTYLAACVLYHTIYGHPASRLPDALPPNNLSVALKRTLRQIADEAAQSAPK